jgi:hypothetical protein
MAFKLTFQTAFKLESDAFLYVKTDPYQYPRMLKSISIDVDGVVLYGVRKGEEEEVFFSARELSDTESVLIRQKYGDGE